MPADGACQLRESTSETSARAAGLILVGNEATEAHPPVYVRMVMCFRLQMVVWKFLWRDWTFHWRIAGEQAHEAVLKKPSVRPNTAPPHTHNFAGNLQGRAVGRSWSNTHMRNFMKLWLCRLSRLHKCDWPSVFLRSCISKSLIKIDVSVPRCWLTQATGQMSRKPTGGHYLILHL